MKATSCAALRADGKAADGGASLTLAPWLPWDEFNRVPVAGVTDITRLSQMLNDAASAFLVLTGEQLVKGVHPGWHLTHGESSA